MLNHFLKHIRLLVLKALGQTTPEEEETLRDAAGGDAGREAFLRSLSDARYYRERAELLKKIDTEEELSRFLKRHRKPVRRLGGIYRQSAAVVVLLLGCGLAIFLNREYRETEPAASPVAAIQPARPGAVLTLSDGSTQVLDPQMVTLTETDGSRILRDSARLNYTGAEGGEQPIYNRLNVGRGYEYMLTLHDGTRVWMNSESVLEYPVTFTDGVRQVKLSGEAYFEVAHDAGRPFRVEVDGRFDVEVLGTRFNVRAYPGDDRAETTLVEGKVAVGGLVLQPSQQAVWHKDRETEVREVNVDYYLAWHEGWFYFNDERLEKALEQIGRWYDVDFTVSGEELRNRRVTGKLERFENLQVILDMLSVTSDCLFETNGRNVNVIANSPK